MANISKSINLRFVVGEVLSQLLNVPIMAGLLMLFFFLKMPVSVPNRISGFILSLIFLCVLPLCSLFLYIPGKLSDREAIVHRQRFASFIFMAVSFPLGIIAAYLANSPKIFKAMAFVYTFVTVGLIVFNKFIHFKASGHASGVAGPVTALIFFFGWIALPSLLLLPLVSWARVSAKGHDRKQIWVGAALSMVITLAVLSLFRFSIFSGTIL